MTFSERRIQARYDRSARRAIREERRQRVLDLAVYAAPARELQPNSANDLVHDILHGMSSDVRTVHPVR